MKAIPMHTAEKIADAEIWQRLTTDPAYQNAESAVDQAEREIAIGDEIWAGIEKEYRIT